MNGRMYDPVVGRMLSTDNNIIGAYSTQGYDRYSYALNNPLKYTDPDGEFVHILVGAAIGAAVHTVGHLFMNGSFENWNWGAFAGSVVAGGVGAGVSSAMTSAGIGGFSGGAVTGAASGFSQSLTSGLINQNLSLAGIIKSTFLGAGIVGLSQGIGAVVNGREFWDGSKVSYEVLVEDASLPHVMQEGKNNCTCATGSAASQGQGSPITQQEIRAAAGGDPELDPLLDTEVMKLTASKTSLNYRNLRPTALSNGTYDTGHIGTAIRDGNSVVATVPPVSGEVAHSVNIKGVYRRNVLQVNGATRSSLRVKVFDPALIQPYYRSTAWVGRLTNIFSLGR